MKTLLSLPLFFGSVLAAQAGAARIECHDQLADPNFRIELLAEMVSSDELRSVRVLAIDERGDVAGLDARAAIVRASEELNTFRLNEEGWSAVEIALPRETSSAQSFTVYLRETAFDQGIYALTCEFR